MALAFFFLILAAILFRISFILYRRSNTNSHNDSISDLSANNPSRQETLHIQSIKVESYIENITNEKQRLKVTFMVYEVFDRFNGHNGESFIVTGINPDTKRKNTVHVKFAYNEEDAINQAISMKSGKLTEPFTASPEIFDRVPSESQISYAKDVLSYIPEDANSFDISCLLTRYEDDDYYLPSCYLVHLGDELHVKMSKYMGAHHLCRAIFSVGTLEQQIFVYIYGVMQSLIDSTLSESSFQICKSFSERYVNDSKFQNSLKNVHPDSWEFDPKSRKYCYLAAKRYLKKEAGLDLLLLRDKV